MQQDLKSVIYNVNLDSINENVILKINKTSTNMYYIANYNKNTLNFNDTKTGQYRSVVFSFADKKVLSFSPPKSSPPMVFMNKYPNVNNNMLITNAMEGVMVTLFYDHAIKKWEIATKGAVGGKYGYYGNIIKKKQEQGFETPSFYRMFLDALRANASEELNDLAILEYFPKTSCYNFILQHPKNIIVLPVESPIVYLVSVYTIDNGIIYLIPQIEYEHWSEFKNMAGIINFPEVHKNLLDYDDMEKIYDAHSTGIMVTNMETGERTKISSKKYDQVCISIKIPTNTQYLYFCLRRINKITEFIEFYPKYRKVFYKIRNEYEDFISFIHKLYMDIYVFKLDTITADEYYKKWCKKIHEELFVPAISKIIPTKITRKIVKEYYDKYEPRELLYIINFEFR